MSNGIISFTRNCLKELKPNVAQIEMQLERSLMSITRLAPLIGYDMASEIAHKAYESGKTIRETIDEMELEIEGNLDEILDPRKMV
jgi:fumarate hydratase class II